MRIPRLRLLMILLAPFLAAWLLLLALEAWFQEGPNYTLIEQNLYIGGLVAKPPRDTCAVINLCEHTDSYACAEHLWEPIRDGDPVPDLDWLQRMVEFIERKQRADETVFVHCRNGVSRSGMVVTAYLMFKNGWTRDEALAFARSKRPLIRPNPLFMMRLNEWEQRLKEYPKPGLAR